MSAHLTVSGDEVGWKAAPATLGDVRKYDSLPKLLAYNAKHFPEQVAQREKDYGIWISYSWADCERHISRMAVGLATLGVGRGDVVALIGDNRPEWVWGEVAAHACRAMSLGIYRDALEEEIRYLIGYAEPKVVIAEDEEQVDKLLELGDAIPSVQHIVYTDPRGMRKYDDPRLMRLEDLEMLGEKPRLPKHRAVCRHGRGDLGRGYCDPVHHLGHHREPQARNVAERRLSRPCDQLSAR